MNAPDDFRQWCTEYGSKYFVQDATNMTEGDIASWRQGFQFFLDRLVPILEALVHDSKVQGVALHATSQLLTNFATVRRDQALLNNLLDAVSKEAASLSSEPEPSHDPVDPLLAFFEDLNSKSKHTHTDAARLWKKKHPDDMRTVEYFAKRIENLKRKRRQNSE